MTRLRIFISYSHRDEFWRARLMNHLSVLEMEGLLHVWADNRIAIGDNWQTRINEAMTDSRAAVLLVTADFLASDFILKREIPELVQQHERQGMQILPVITRPCPWKLVTWIADRQVRPKYGRPLSSGNEFQIDADLAALSYEIAALIGRIDTRVASDEMAGAELSAKQNRLAYSEPFVTGREGINNISANLVDHAISELSSLFIRSSRPDSTQTRALTEAVLTTAINYGVPLFNTGSPLGCAIVYSFAAATLLDRLESQARQSHRAGDPSNADIMRILSSVDPQFMPANYPDANGYAWKFRHAFNEILSRNPAT
jgi:hypothetical protein